MTKETNVLYEQVRALHCYPAVLFTYRLPRAYTRVATGVRVRRRLMTTRKTTAYCMKHCEALFCYSVVANDAPLLCVLSAMAAAAYGSPVAAL